MRINTALILCAGFGKRLNPITANIPKPLIIYKKITLLENTINLLIDLKIKNIKINVFYLKEKIQQFIKDKNFPVKIEILEDGETILGTGGGTLNLMSNTKENDLLVINPDTIWNKNYIVEIQNMEKFYFENKIKNILLVVEKSNSFDQRMKGDFSIKNNILKKKFDKNFIFTGCQILNKSIFENYKIETFSINRIWEEMISNDKLYGYISKVKFTHLTDIEIYNKITKT